MKQRIQKVLAAAGVASRRAIEQMIRDGRVSVNGKIQLSIPVMVDTARDRVEIDGEPIAVAGGADDRRIYILLNKPARVYSTNVSQGEQTRAIDLLPANIPRVYPVGRLDADSKGLLLLTNDGELTNQLTHPRYGVAKTYRASVDGYMTAETISSLEHGIRMADRSGEGVKAGRSHIKLVDRSRQRTVLEIVIREGRNRQLRPMLAGVGHKVRELVRIRMGPLTLDGLSVGESRLLTAREVKQLKSLGQSGEPAEEKKPREKAERKKAQQNWIREVPAD